MSVRDLFQTSTFQYTLPDITTAQDGDQITYSATARGLVFGSSSPGENVVTVSQQFVASLTGATGTTSDPFTLVFKKDLQTNLVTVAFSPLQIETQAGTTWTHTVPFLNTGAAGEFQWLLTPHGTVDPNYSQMLPSSASVQFDGNTNIYNALFSTWPTTWYYTYMPMSAVFTIGHLGTMNIICKSSVIQQNEFCSLTRPDGFAGSTAILGQYLYTD